MVKSLSSIILSAEWTKAPELLELEVEDDKDEGWEDDREGLEIDDGPLLLFLSSSPGSGYRALFGKN